MPSISLDLQSLRSIFGKGRLIMPRYQRDFSWEGKQIDELLQDLEDCAKLGADEYYLNQIIIVPNASESVGGVAGYDLIDGQQRLTTLSIILSELAKLSTAEATDLDVANLVTATQVQIEDQFGETIAVPILKPSFPGGEQCLNEIIFKMPENRVFSTPPNASTLRLQKCAERVRRELNKWILESGLKAEKLGKNLLNKVKVGVLENSDVDEAIAVFETTNNRGLILRQGDLIKVELFRRAQSESEFATLQSHWNAMVQSLSNIPSGKLSNNEFLFSSLATADTGVPTKSTKVLRYVKERFENPQVATSNSVLKFSSSKDFIISASQISPVYADLTQSRSPFTGDLLSLDGSKHFGVVQHFSALLAAYSNGPEVFQRFVPLIENRAVAYVLSQSRTQNFEKEIAAFANKVLALRPDSPEDELIEIETEFQSGTKRDLSILEGAMFNWSYSDPSDRARIKFVLCRISHELQQAAGLPEGGNDMKYLLKSANPPAFCWHLDHVFARSLAGVQRDEDLPDGSKWIDGIGNLVLLWGIDNVDAGAGRPEQKIALYQNQVLLLTRSLSFHELNSEASQHHEDEEKASVMIADRRGREILDHFGPGSSLADWNADSANLRFNLYHNMLQESLLSGIQRI